MKKFLKDVDKNGKEIDWRGKKVSNLWLAEAYTRLGMDKAHRVVLCGSCLGFEVQEVPDGENKRKLKYGYFCKIPLCPMCSWRRSRKIFGQVSQVMDYVAPKDYRYVFLTLTMKNVPGNLLDAAVDDLLGGFKKLIRRKQFKEMSEGFFRCLEITHNWGRNDYHPHLHVMIAVDKRYFSEYRNYIKHGEWKDLWQSCLNVSYQPWVHICKVRGRVDSSAPMPGTISYGKAVAEIAKYSVKGADYLVMWQDRAGFLKKTGIKLQSVQQCKDLTDEVVGVLDKVLHRRRLVAFGGELKRVHKLLNLDDPVDGDLVVTDNQEINKELAAIIEKYYWNAGVGNYVLAKARKA